MGLVEGSHSGGTKPNKDMERVQLRVGRSRQACVHLKRAELLVFFNKY